MWLLPSLPDIISMGSLILQHIHWKELGVCSMHMNTHHGAKHGVLKQNKYVTIYFSNIGISLNHQHKSITPWQEGKKVTSSHGWWSHICSNSSETIDDGKKQHAQARHIQHAWCSKDQIPRRLKDSHPPARWVTAKCWWQWQWVDCCMATGTNWCINPANSRCYNPL